MRIVSTDPNHAGIFAFGQVAVGIIAFGQAALGVVAVGQLARGFFCLGQGAIGIVAVGQGAVGLWHGTGMIAIAGQRGYGLALHLLPRIVTEPRPELPAPTPIEALVERTQDTGWLMAKLLPSGLVEPDDQQVRIDTSNVFAQLRTQASKGLDRAHLKVRANMVPDAAGYRSGRSHVELVAEEAIAYSSHVKRYLAFGVPPAGKPGGPTSTLMIAVRLVVWMMAVGLWAVLAVLPLVDAFTD